MTLFYHPESQVILETKPEGKPEVVATGVRGDVGHAMAAAPELLQSALYTEKLLQWAMEYVDESIMPTELKPMHRKLLEVQKAIGRTK